VGAVIRGLKNTRVVCDHDPGKSLKWHYSG
jgi:hypothetical protein